MLDPSKQTIDDNTEALLSQNTETKCVMEAPPILQIAPMMLCSLV